MGKLTQQLGEVILDLPASGRLTHSQAEVFLVPTDAGRLSHAQIEAFVVPTAAGRLSHSQIEAFWSFQRPTAIVPDITGFTNQTATFDSSASTGGFGDGTTLERKFWSWTSVPGGSAIANISPTPMPDSGGSSFIAMTSNAVLYHCEGSGTDSSGNGNTATFSNVTTGAAGKVGSFAWSFDTTAAYATLTTQVSLAGDHTFACWFYNLGPDTVYRSGTTDNPPSTILFIVEAITGRLGVWNGSFQDSGFTMRAADFTGWHHLVAVGSGTTTRMYVDGIYVGTVAVKLATNIKYVGNSVGQTQRFADRMDEIAIWTRALSQAEVETLYINQAGTYAGRGTTFGFVPDVEGTYTVQFTVRDTLREAYYPLGSDLANAVITDPPVGSGVWPQEGLAIMPGVQGQRLKRHRGQM